MTSRNISIAESQEHIPNKIVTKQMKSLWSNRLETFSGIIMGIKTGWSLSKWLASMASEDDVCAWGLQKDRKPKGENAFTEVVESVSGGGDTVVDVVIISAISCKITSKIFEFINHCYLETAFPSNRE